MVDPALADPTLANLCEECDNVLIGWGYIISKEDNSWAVLFSKSMTYISGGTASFA